MNRARRSFVPHCVWCFADHCEVELQPFTNSFTKATQLWCCDWEACKARRDAPPAPRRKKRAA